MAHAPADLEAAVDRFFRAAEARDFETFRSGFADAPEIFQNGDALGLDDLVAFAQKGTKSVRYVDVRRIVADGAVVEQHRAEIVFPDGTPYTSRDICVVFRFDADGRFSRVEEYAPLQGVPR